MKNIFKSLNNYTKNEWVFIKAPFALILLLMFAYVYYFTENPSFPLSICKIFNCSIILKLPISISLFTLSCIATIFYLFEKYMITSLSFLSIVAILTFSTADSAGVFDRFDVVSLVLIAQLIAYLYAYFSKEGVIFLFKNRIQFPIQLIAAAYTLSAFSKLYNSGFSWVNNNEGLAIQSIKAIGHKYMTEGSDTLLLKLDVMPTFILEHPGLVTTLLSFSLFIELFAIIAVFSKRNAFIWGLLLCGMHLGIFIFMSVMIKPIILSMIIFFVNPLYIIYILLTKHED